LLVLTQFQKGGGSVGTIVGRLIIKVFLGDWRVAIQAWIQMLRVFTHGKTWVFEKLFWLFLRANSRVI